MLTPNVRYAGQKGCEITISASGSSRSETEFGPSCQEVPKASAASPLSHRPRKPPNTRRETANPPGDPEVTRHLVVGQSEICTS